MLRFTENVTLRFVLNSTIYGHCTGNLINIYAYITRITSDWNNFYKYDLLEICSLAFSSLLVYSSQEISSPKDKRKLRKRIVVHKYDLRAKG